MIVMAPSLSAFFNLSRSAQTWAMRDFNCAISSPAGMSGEMGGEAGLRSERVMPDCMQAAYQAIDAAIYVIGKQQTHPFTQTVEVRVEVRFSGQIR